MTSSRRSRPSSKNYSAFLSEIPRLAKTAERGIFAASNESEDSVISHAGAGRKDDGDTGGTFDAAANGVAQVLGVAIGQ